MNFNVKKKLKTIQGESERKLLTGFSASFASYEFQRVSLLDVIISLLSYIKILKLLQFIVFVFHFPVISIETSFYQQP